MRAVYALWIGMGLGALCAALGHWHRKVLAVVVAAGVSAGVGLVVLYTLGR